jgi:surfactin synthase thioesterase subunit
VRRYTPQPYLGRLHLFMAHETMRSPADSRLSWRELATDGAEIHVIPGNHDAITGNNDTVEEAYMRVLAEQLRVCIDDAVAKG